jgi:hypothetical protein
MDKEKEITLENTITEGKASVYLENTEQTFSAFYNPAQVYHNIIRNSIEIYLLLV